MQTKVEGFRLSPQQRYLWSLQQASASQPYQVQSVISINGELRTEVLESALTEVVRRHEILRTTFQRPPGIKIPFQVISEKAQFFWQVTDLSDLGQEALLTCLETDRSKCFDLERGPLLRASLYKLSREHHILAISLPALCADPVTVANLCRELASAYDGGFPEQSMQYADFAEWHNESLEELDTQAEGRNYWQQLMGTQVSSLALPLEKRRSDGQPFQPETVSIDLDSKCCANIETLARDFGTSSQCVLFAFWEALVWRLTNQSHFVIFNLWDGRNFEDLQSALGAYAKYLPVSCSCEDVSFASHLHGTSTAFGTVEEWQEYFDPNNFPEATRDAIGFDFNDQHSPIETAGLKLSLTSNEVCLGPFKLRLSCFRSSGSIRAELVYNAHCFDRETIIRYAGYFSNLVSNASQTNITVGEIEILSETERRQLVVDLNQTDAEFSVANSIHELFEEQVARTPEAPAVVSNDLELTYFELNRRANQLAHLLRRRGVGLNACVGICMDRSAEAIIALLGILKADGAYVPLNPEHPSARLTMQLLESSASFLITNGSTSSESLEFSGEIIDLEHDRAALLAESDSNPASIGGAASLAYVIYTSGSSGVPKGVAVGHQALLNYTQFILRRLYVKEPLHFATVSTITADLGNTCIFPALVSGGCLHLISNDVAMDSALFSEHVTKFSIDVLKIVPSHLSALLTATDVDILPGKYLILGGEALSWELVDRISQTNPRCEVLNHYGPTETTVGSLTFRVKPKEVSTQSLTVPIGHPISNTHVYILDPHLKPMPIGVAGELYIGGAGLAEGYLNQPGETAARFVPNHFSDKPGARLYRTGDLARYLPDGTIEFLGRIDHQVKVRGFRVELAEIEAVLMTHHKVRQAVVVADPATTQNQRLVGYVVTSGSEQPGPEELRTFLGQQVPDYMIPSVFVYLKTMPLTPNGKIDRSSLPDPNEARADLQRSFVAPRTAIEKTLANIWAELLNLNEVGVNDNFFELGGHSLLATQVVSRMRKTFNCEMPLRNLFESPTIAQIAQQIASSTATETERLLAEIEELSDEEANNVLRRNRDDLIDEPTR